jgi:hypothetical protein
MEWINFFVEFFLIELVNRKRAQMLAMYSAFIERHFQAKCQHGFEWIGKFVCQRPWTIIITV